MIYLKELYTHLKVRKSHGYKYRTLVFYERNYRIPWVSRDTVLNWIEKRNMPAAKIGRLWKFKISEVDAWMKSGKSAK